MTIKSDSALPGVSYVEWSSVIAGTVLALALSLILIQFSSMIGLAVFEPHEADDKTRWLVIISAVWLFWVQLISSMAGGYMSGRMRAPVANAVESESEVRDGAHGLLVWATATVIAVAAAGIASAITAVTHTPTGAEQHHADVAAHLTKNAAIIFGFGAAAGSLVSAAAAAWTATIGGDHRNKSLRFSAFRRRA